MMVEATLAIIFSFITKLKGDDDEILEFDDSSLSVEIMVTKHQRTAK